MWELSELFLVRHPTSQVHRRSWGCRLGTSRVAAPAKRMTTWTTGLPCPGNCLRSSSWGVATRASLQLDSFMNVTHSYTEGSLASIAALLLPAVHPPPSDPCHSHSHQHQSALICDQQQHLQGTVSSISSSLVVFPVWARCLGSRVTSQRPGTGITAPTLSSLWSSCAR